MPASSNICLRHIALALATSAVLVATVAAGPVMAASLEATTTPTPLETALTSVFTVHTADNQNRFLGSAFLWGQGEVAITNAHVVGNATEVRLTDASGAEQIAQVIGSDPSRDVAVIAVKPGGLGLIPSTSAPRLGAEVWALGAPLGIAFTVTEGQISALSRQVDPAQPIHMLQHDAAVNPGSSGGPLVDATGALLGMNAQIADGSRMFVGIAYAIPATDLSRIVAGLIDETLLPLPKLGLTARPLDRQLAQALQLAATGLLVDSVEAASLAATAGILPGDVLLAVNGRQVQQPGDLAFALESAQAAAAFDFTLLRGNAVLVLIAKAQAEPASLTQRDANAAPQRIAQYSLQTLGISLTGQLIADVTDNSPALFAGVAKGDSIVQLNGQTLDAAALAALTIDQPVLLLLQGETGTRHVLIDPWATGKTLRPLGGANVLDPDVVVF